MDKKHSVKIAEMEQAKYAWDQDWHRLKNMPFGAWVTESGQTGFRMYAEQVSGIYVRVYSSPMVIGGGQNEGESRLYELTKVDVGLLTAPGVLYETVIDEDLSGWYYEWEIQRKDKRLRCQDPWAKSMTTDSQLGYIVNWESVNPKGWSTQVLPMPLKRTESVLYETHLRDYTTSPYTSCSNKAKYLGFGERGTQTSEGLTSGIDHLAELGITHVHLLPLHDVGSMDETFGGYNWGYDPAFFMVPEGAYATDSGDASVRVREMKTMIQSIHQAGIRVVLDVVYNHVWDAAEHPFEVLAPGQYFRKDKFGTFSNGSGCGNETRSESVLFTKYVWDSLEVYVDQYKVDGFRFDLMALHDHRFIKVLSKALHEKRPEILIYGEPWIGGQSRLARKNQFRQGDQRRLNVSLFNDHLRNAIKGDNDGSLKGFVSGGKRLEKAVAKGIVGGVDYLSTLSGKRLALKDFTDAPGEAVNYVSCHDNLCLLDKFIKTHPEEDLMGGVGWMSRSLMSIGLVMLSFGIPFLQGGTELLRTKRGDHNSFISGDRINQIPWENKAKYRSYYEAVRTLIALRKRMGCFEVDSASWINEHVKFYALKSGLIAYGIQTMEGLWTIHFNALDRAVSLGDSLPERIETAEPTMFFRASDWLETTGKDSGAGPLDPDLWAVDMEKRHRMAMTVPSGDFIVVLWRTAEVLR